MRGLIYAACESYLTLARRRATSSLWSDRQRARRPASALRSARCRPAALDARTRCMRLSGAVIILSGPRAPRVYLALLGSRRVLRRSSTVDLALRALWRPRRRGASPAAPRGFEIAARGPAGASLRELRVLPASTALARLVVSPGETRSSRCERGAAAGGEVCLGPDPRRSGAKSPGLARPRGCRPSRCVPGGAHLAGEGPSVSPPHRARGLPRWYGTRHRAADAGSIERLRTRWDRRLVREIAARTVIVRDRRRARTMGGPERRP